MPLSRTLDRPVAAAIVACPQPLSQHHQRLPLTMRFVRMGPSREKRFPVSKRTFQPNNRRRAKTHGFRLRMRTRAGRAILGARRRKGRSELSA